MNKVGIHLSVDQHVWTEIRNRPELNEKVSSFVNECLASLLLDDSYKGEAELLKQQADLSAQRDKIDTEQAVIEGRLAMLREQQKVSANEELRKKMEFARAARLNEV